MKIVPKFNEQSSRCNKTIMRFQIFVVLFCATFSSLMANESSTIESEQFAAEIVHTPVDTTDVVNDAQKNDKDAVKNVESVDENIDGELPAEHEIEHIDHSEDVASGETEHVESEVIQSIQPVNGSVRAFGRSGNYQYDEFLGGLDYLGPGYDFNPGYDAGE